MNYIQEMESRIAKALRTMIDKGNESKDHKEALEEYHQFKCESLNRKSHSSYSPSSRD